MPIGTIGFTVACSSTESPGLDGVGDFTLLISFKFSDMKEPVFIPVPVHGQSDGTAGDGDDTAEIAGSADAAVNQAVKEGKLGKHGSNIFVQVDNGVPGGTRGRVRVDDDKLESLDAAENAGGKLKIEIVYDKTKGTGPGPFPGGTPKPGRPGGWKTELDKPEPLNPPSGGEPGIGEGKWHYVDPKRNWFFPRPWKRRPRRKTSAKDEKKQVGAPYPRSERSLRGLVLVESSGADPLEDPYTGLEFALVPFDIVPDSIEAQAESLYASLRAAGVRSVRLACGVGILSSWPDEPFGAGPAAIGVRTSMPGASAVFGAAFRWDVVVGHDAALPGFFIRLDPAPSLFRYMASQIAVRPRMIPLGERTHLQGRHLEPHANLDQDSAVSVGLDPANSRGLRQVQPQPRPALREDG
ncbi:MAG: hypothetical protein HMLKMBBP_02811 [Planctomycetes bacterium]|nr:hypothetical protein [Planctomycetota bacterium]